MKELRRNQQFLNGECVDLHKNKLKECCCNDRKGKGQINTWDLYFLKVKKACYTNALLTDLKKIHIQT